MKNFCNNKNAYIFYPTDNMAEIQSIVDNIYVLTEAGHFIKERFLLLFAPGYYNIDLKVGFYTEVMGLGFSMRDTIIKKVSSLARWKENYNALCNFTRRIHNFTVEEDLIWATSQACDVREICCLKNMYLYDTAGYASGGFLADSYIYGNIYSGPQQQFLIRNTYFKQFFGNNWNIVFVDCPNAPVEDGKYNITTIESSKIFCKAPKLISLNDEIYILTYEKYEINRNKNEIMHLHSLKEFKIINDSQNLNELDFINKKIIVLPGIYNVLKPIIINDNDIFISLGFATLVADNDFSVFTIVGTGFILHGLFIEALRSKYLITSNRVKTNRYSLISSLVCRIGGHEDSKTCLDICINNEIDNVIFDSQWLWRADHTYGVGWDINIANTGLISKGNNCFYYALMVEHFQKYQTIFEGNDNYVYLYQCETPYDCPNQESYKVDDRLGCACYYVLDYVNTHYAYGIGIYSVFLKAPLLLESAIITPKKENIKFHHIITQVLGHNFGIVNVVNNEKGIEINEKLHTKIILDY